eukprot:gnl/TRDRNA2_/TRDRNA2_218151_c0_seq1.p2 gnl/TRDRNA2_/TRDRNA2_218151_c0~~gnl/TRDRNA2_/TRDRNA2_218151_c0_seq1.p2  ORF type:complete len:105 (-),score=7.72 gnl/TRDRNA2_/TRDRNA2_218151_c0_seq1:8-322(-)
MEARMEDLAVVKGGPDVEQKLGGCMSSHYRNLHAACQRMPMRSRRDCRYVESLYTAKGNSVRNLHRLESPATYSAPASLPVSAADPVAAWGSALSVVNPLMSRS